MDEKRIGEIVKKMFETSKSRCVSDSKYALARHIEQEISLSYKTLERAYDRYIDGKDTGAPLSESVNLFCKYLGYESYEDYITNNPDKNKDSPGAVQHASIKSLKKEKHTPLLKIFKSKIITVLLILIFTIAGTKIYKAIIKEPETTSQTEKYCMTWANTHYEKVACSLVPFSKYGTKIEPLNKAKLDNFKKVNVTMTTTFFTQDTNQALIWYYKNKEGEIEYFTAPGLHPVYGKTLKEITPYIIQKYVPLHLNKEDSFLE
ncbi:hypothetical protein [Ascidiimonas aurantiaca]|uniref:hypothetical protein n=1 Tax=Ascidiimonas aurantiaca TaxID=1685432 RepID=UPI0030EE00E1